MKVKSLSLRVIAVTAVAALALGGSMFSAQAANPTFIDCQA